MSLYERLDVLFSSIQAAALIVGFYYAHRQLRLLKLDVHNSLELASRQHAMDLMARYAAPEAARLRHELRTNAATQSDYYACCALLNSLEEIAIAFKHRTANPLILQDAFATTLRGWIEKPYIADAIRQARQKDPARYENVLNLYFTWGGSDALIRSIQQVAEFEVE